MTRFACVARGLAVLALIGVVTAASADGEKAPSIKEVMGKLNKGPDCLMKMVTKELRASQPDWDQIQKNSKEYVVGTEALEKATPKKGDKDSWTRLTKSFHENAVALNTAAEKKDKDAAVAANAKLGTACMSCHRAHKG
jgi:hypothetical protein